MSRGLRRSAATTGSNGLRCLRCHEVFSKARTFVGQHCWAVMREEKRRWLERSELRAQLRTVIGAAETLRGEQLPLLNSDL